MFRPHLQSCACCVLLLASAACGDTNQNDSDSPTVTGNTTANGTTGTGTSGQTSSLGGSTSDGSTSQANSTNSTSGGGTGTSGGGASGGTAAGNAGSGGSVADGGTAGAAGAAGEATTGGGGEGSDPACEALDCGYNPETFSFERCEHLDGACGRIDPEDVACVQQPLDCIYPWPTWYPACSCSGTVIPMDCGYSDTQAPENCDQISCGGTLCDKQTEYCEREEDGGTCVPLPAACGNEPDCDCFAEERCASGCRGSAEFGFMLACIPPS